MVEHRVLPFPSSDSRTGAWQVCFFRLPSWVKEEGDPFRPVAALAVCTETGLIGMSTLVPPSDCGVAEALAAIESLQGTLGRAPTAIEVEDPDLGAALGSALEERGVPVECRDELPAVGPVLREMRKDQASDDAMPSATDVPGVRVEHLRAFAEAAAAFAEAAPWTRLSSSDIVEVAAPRPAQTVRFVSVMGADEQFGVACARDRAPFDAEDQEEYFAYLESDSFWSVSFTEPWLVGIPEHDLWLDHGFPTGPAEWIPDGWIPTAVEYGPKRRVRRASPRMLAFFEGLLRALAETTEDEMDEGEWQKKVETSEGPLELSLSLPDLLSAPAAPPADSVGPLSSLRSGLAMEALGKLMEDQSFESEEEMREFLEREVIGRRLPEPEVEGPQDEARELALEAIDTPGRRGIALARRALGLDPDSPVAHLALAMKARDPETRLQRYGAAVAAAERALDPSRFKDDVGRFWSIPETRPYMEARQGLAASLWLAGRRREAVEHYSDMLRLNPHDNQGVREVVVPHLIVLGEDEQAEEVLAKYPDDAFSSAHFNRALLAFRRHGDGSEARDLLGEAVSQNQHVPALLLDPDSLPDDIPDSFQLGDETEAAYYCFEALEAWGETPGALEWLDGFMSAHVLPETEE